MTGAEVRMLSRVDHHHDHIWARLPFVVPMAIKLARECDAEHCAELAERVAELRCFVFDHLAREEGVLDQLDARAHPAGLADRLAQIHDEHVALERLLAQVRISAGGAYRPAAEACPTERALYRELACLERHLRCQMTLEERLLARLWDVDAR